jgi:hypothetical protein
VYLSAEMLEVSVADGRDELIVQSNAVPLGELPDNPPIGSARHRNALKGGDGEEVGERASHRTSAGTARQNERPVDIEQDERAQPSPRTFPARGPLAEGSSSKLTR